MNFTSNVNKIINLYPDFTIHDSDCASVALFSDKGYRSTHVHASSARDDVGPCHSHLNMVLIVST